MILHVKSSSRQVQLVCYYNLFNKLAQYAKAALSQTSYYR